MGKKLVIVESPAKARTINKILGHDFMVKASMGHVRDLPERGLSIEIDKGFEPQYVAIKSRAKIIKELQEAAGKADFVYLAPDPDREGEAIAWHLREVLKKKIAADKFQRVSYNEITAPAIRKAFEHPGEIRQSRVESQQARRILDRIVGYMVSPLLWRRIQGASSAGRVQSVALRLVCEREQAIKAFVPEAYWVLGAKAAKLVDPRTPFLLKLARINDEKAEVKQEQQAQNILAELKTRNLEVADILFKEISRRPYPPFITSSLQQSASSQLGFTPKRTMSVAQKLYEGVELGGQGATGLITYMRTDSFNVSREAQEGCLQYVREILGAEYAPERPNFYKSRSSAQEAHEAIRPTDVRRTPEQMASILQGDDWKLYQLIWQRFVASQMTPARIAQRTAEVDAPPVAGQQNRYLFRATASEIVFPGFMKVLGMDEARKKGGGEEGDEVEALPPLEKGEKLDCLEWLSDQKMTQPPPRFTEASLVKALEENGVGRPSTYAQIITTLYDRKYVEKDKRALLPTLLGMQVNEFLVQHLGELFDVTFTAGMEESLDKIEEGQLPWAGMLREFYDRFHGWIEKARGPSADSAAVGKILGVLEAIREWGPEVKRGNRIYGDKKFVESVRKQHQEGGKPISERQLDALKKMMVRYREQLPDYEALAATWKLNELPAPAQTAPPDEKTLQKLALLEKVKFDEARKIGKRVFDDKKFFESLRNQAQSGKGLSINQLSHIDKMVRKYSEQIENYASHAEALGLNQPEATDDKESGPVLELLKAVQQWRPVSKRGAREWDDFKFFESLRKQFEQRNQLSFKQRAALKRMASVYAAQIPNYEAAMQQYGLPPPKAPKAAAKTE